MATGPDSSNARMGTVPYALIAIAQAICKSTQFRIKGSELVDPKLED